MKRRYQPDSIAWVQHGSRGRVMPWAISVPRKELILSLARGKYQGCNDSHLTEKLRDEENLTVSRETVRRILRGRQPSFCTETPATKISFCRPPPRFGMMALTDASTHDWLEGRGPVLTLIGFQDDASSQILYAHFQLEAENRPRVHPAGLARVVETAQPLIVFTFEIRDQSWQAALSSSGTSLGQLSAILSVSVTPGRSARTANR